MLQDVTALILFPESLFIGSPLWGWALLFPWKLTSIGDFGIISSLKKTHLTGCIRKIIAFYETLNDKKASHIHKHLMKKWEITDTIISY